MVLKIVRDRLSKYAEGIDLLPEEQCGFRPRRSTTDMLYVVQMLQEFGRVKKIPLYFCFIDLTKAYDTVNRELLWKVLAKVGVPQDLIELIKAFHDGTRACVRIDGEDSDYFSVNQGLRQGCVLSPLLFNIFFGAVLEIVKKRILADEATNKDLASVKTFLSVDPWNYEARKDVTDENITVKKLWSMLYADDAAIVSRSETGLSSMMTILVEATSQFGLMVSENKTKTMYAARMSELKVKTVELKVQAGGQSYDQVLNFTYLGTRLTEGGGVTEEIAKRKSKAWGKWMVRKKVLYQNRDIKASVKLMMLKQEVVETLLYGCATWATKVEDMVALDQVHYRLLVQTLGLWRTRKTNLPPSYSSILKKYGLMSMEATVKYRRLKWAGSVIKMKSDRLPKIMMFGELVEGKRCVGRPPTQWNLVVQDDMIDFDWIKKKKQVGKIETSAEKKVWMEYQAQIWKDEISPMAVLHPREWEDNLFKGAVHFMAKWHEKKDQESVKRRRKRVFENLRLKFWVFDGWSPPSNSTMGWEKIGEGWKKKEKVTSWVRIKNKGQFEKRWEKKVFEFEDSGSAGWEKFEVNLKEVRYELRKGEWELRERPADTKSVEQTRKEELWYKELKKKKRKKKPEGKPEGWMWFEKTSKEVQDEIVLVYGLSEWKLRRVV
jgi:hypothetical protein